MIDHILLKNYQNCVTTHNVNFGIKASTVRQFLISSGLPSKKAIQIVNQTLNELKVEKHPDKTFIGRIAKGFDFLGYSFEPKGLSLAPKTLANFLERITQLYEQGADNRRIGQYVRNWLRWVRAGVVISDEPSHIRARINSH